MINRISDIDIDAPGDGLRRTRPGRAAEGPGDRSPLVGLGRQIETYIGDHPVMSLAIGLTIGIVIGCLIKRR